jgi:hypothetical protein
LCRWAGAANGQVSQSFGLGDPRLVWCSSSNGEVDCTIERVESGEGAILAGGSSDLCGFSLEEGVSCYGLAPTNLMIDPDRDGVTSQFGLDKFRLIRPSGPIMIRMAWVIIRIQMMIMMAFSI